MVIRRGEGDAALQGLRTALSLSLGDRRPALFLLGSAADVLGADPASEAGQCLATLRAAGVPIVVDTSTPPSHAIAAAAAADFQQTF